MPTTVTRYATTVASSGSPTLGTPANAMGAPDGTTSSANIASTSTGPIISFSGYGFTADDLPADAAIDALTFYFTTRASSSNVTTDYYAIKYYDESAGAGAIGPKFLENTGVAFPTTLQTKTDRVLTATTQVALTRTMILNSMFGVIMKPKALSGTNGFLVDAMGISVEYHETKRKLAFVKVNGVWKPIDPVKVRLNGTWRDGKLWTKHNGVWKQVFGAV